MASLRRDSARVREATPFVVFTTQRNGSTWLISVLNSIDDVSAQGELFLPRPRSPEKRWDSEFAYPRYIQSKAQFGYVRPFSVFRYLRTLYSRPGSVGFKLMYSQVKSFPEILLYLRRERIRVVHLVRGNHLDVLISFAIKRHIGRAHILAASDRPKGVMIDIAADSLVRDLNRLQFKHDVGRKLLRFSGLPHIEVTYEDLLAKRAPFDCLLEFLNIPLDGELPESHILKSRLGTQREVVRNYEEVRRVLKRSKFAELLE